MGHNGDLRDPLQCRTCGKVSKTKHYFCSKKCAIEFAITFAKVGYSLIDGKPEPTWTTASAKE